MLLLGSSGIGKSSGLLAAHCHLASMDSPYVVADGRPIVTVFVSLDLDEAFSRTCSWW
jgi:ABC-type cobalamin/Fe3+-siderophores transport system ATPase subunit